MLVAAMGTLVGCQMLAEVPREVLGDLCLPEHRFGIIYIHRLPRSAFLGHGLFLSSLFRRICKISRNILHNPLTLPSIMRFADVALAFSAIVAHAAAQRPSNTSICDYYTTALFKSNTADNQYSLLVALVNTVVIGNCEASLQACHLSPSNE